MLCKSNSGRIYKRVILGSVGGVPPPDLFHVCSLFGDKGNKGRDVWGVVRRGHAKCRGGGDRARIPHETNLRMPASSIFRRIGSALRDDEENLEGFMVLEERPLSVLELVTELKREVPSFVMVASCGDQWGMAGGYVQLGRATGARARRRR